VNDGGENDVGSFEVRIGTDAAKFTNRRIAIIAYLDVEDI